MTSPQDYTPATSISTKFGTYVLGFGVSIAIGLAPFLGKQRVPLFAPVIDLYPAEMQNWVIPLSGLLMGMIAVLVEYAHERQARLGQTKFDHWFVRIAIAFFAAFLLLLFRYTFTVTHIEKTAGTPPEIVSIAVVTGAIEVPPQRANSKCGCEEGDPAVDCVSNITANPANVRRCFGATRIAVATLILATLYFILTGAFAAAVGLLLVTKLRRNPATTPATIDA